VLFNSFTFWAFYAVVFILYWRLPHKWQNRLLLVASYVFYGAWDWRFLSLIVISTLIDYFVGRRLSRTLGERQRKLTLLISIVGNLGLLGVFKYYNFFSSQLSALLHVVGIPAMLPSMYIVLPVGISFYTFQTMSYTIDVYRGKTTAARNLLDFALYVSFFPQLVAGPIERSSRLLPQVVNPRVRRQSDIPEGLYLVVLGLFKKVVIADNMAQIVNAVFVRDPATLSGLECLVGVYAFAFQIYGDFSGYSAIARGVARWLGFDLMENFHMPYFSVSPSDFWKRWHISLSSWLRDYLYIPLGGNRGGRFMTYRNLMLTMLLGGLWHGAAWTFVAWGAFHGVLLCVYRAAGDSGAAEGNRFFSLTRWVHAFVMFQLVCVGWLLFRAQSLHQAWEMSVRIATSFHATPVAIGLLGTICFYVAPLMLFELWLEKGGEVLRLPRTHWVMESVFYAYCFGMLWFLPAPTHHEFIYFQF